MSLYHESITMPTRKELLQRQRFLEKTKAKLERSLAAPLRQAAFPPAGREVCLFQMAMSMPSLPVITM